MHKSYITHQTTEKSILKLISTICIQIRELYTVIASDHTNMVSSSKIILN